MLYNYNKFIFEKEIQREVDIWIHLHESQNESINVLYDRIKDFISKKIKEIGNDENRILEFLSHIFRNILRKSKKSLLILVILFNQLPHLQRGIEGDFCFSFEIQIPPSPPFTKWGMPLRSPISANKRFRLIWGQLTIE